MWRWFLRLFGLQPIAPEPPDSDFPRYYFTDPIPLDADCPDTQPTDWGKP